MKVLCIKDSDGCGMTKSGQFRDASADRVLFGEKYTVIDVMTSWKGPSLNSFKLAERPSNRWYREIYFSPLSNIDETTFEREYNKIAL